MNSKNNYKSGDDDEEDVAVPVPVPGFRFHPTDEELVGFYLRRKLAKKPLSIDLIKQIDIYKYDPWDLPKLSNLSREKEHYFFCKRGRKYRNSVRPNRVTGSGFWKATGIDKPVYSQEGEGHDCIGLKKTLVYYRGSAGKGNKTDWMMHEFRLPSNDKNKNTDNLQEAEIWTLCRVFKRNGSHKKYIPDWKNFSSKRHHSNGKISKSSSSCSEDSNCQEAYISFRSSGYNSHEQRPAVGYSNNPRITHLLFDDHQLSSSITTTGNQLSSTVSVRETHVHHPTVDSSCFWGNQDYSDCYLFPNVKWDELGSVVQCALDQI